MVDLVVSDESHPLRWGDGVARVEVEVFSPPEAEVVSYLSLRVVGVASCLYPRKDCESSDCLREASCVSCLHLVARSAVAMGAPLGLEAALPFPNGHMDQDHQTVVSHHHG